MIKILKISEEKALELYKTASNEFKQLLEENFGKEFFVPKSIIDRIQDLDDIWEILDLDEEDIVPFSKPKNTFQKYMNSCAIIPHIVKVYNEGKELDWTNVSEYKYLPWFIFSTSAGWSFRDAYCTLYATGPAGHHYKSRELLNDGCKKFNETYINYFSFKG